MTPAEFVAKWSKSTVSEKSACQQHFLDLCVLLGQPKPAAADLSLKDYHPGLFAGGHERTVERHQRTDERYQPGKTQTSRHNE